MHGRRLSVAGSFFTILVMLYVFVDRPASTWVHASFGADGQGTVIRRVCIALTHLVDPIVPLSILCLVAIGPVVAGAANPPQFARGLFATALATLVAAATKDQLKLAFGRLWPETWTNGNPSWIGGGVFGFSPFHGGTGWASFPSGHMAVIAAPMVILMIVRPAWRAAASAPIMLVAVGLYGADYHFLSDIVAGTGVGAACAVIVWSAVMRSASPGSLAGAEAPNRAP